MEQSKRIYLKFEKINEEVKLEQNFEKDEENYVYKMGIASTEDENSAGFVVENRALLEAWNNNKANGKNVAVYEKHGYPIGKVVNCEEYNKKILIVMEIPKQGNDRVLALFEQGIYVGLSIGGWSLDGEWIRNETGEDIFHVTEFDWYETSWTDIPSNENALMLEAAQATKPKAADDKQEDKKDEEPKDEKVEEENSDDDKPKEDVEEECKKKLEQEKKQKEIEITLEKILDTIRGKN